MNARSKIFARIRPFLKMYRKLYPLGLIPAAAKKISQEIFERLDKGQKQKATSAVANVAPSKLFPTMYFGATNSEMGRCLTQDGRYLPSCVFFKASGKNFGARAL